MEVDLQLDGTRFHVRLEEEDGRLVADVDGDRFAVHVDRRGGGAAVAVGGYLHLVELTDAHTARIDGRELPFLLESMQGVAGAPDAAAVFGPIHPPMTGTLAEVLVEAGQEVKAGDVLFVLEAMKMRNEVKAPTDGVVEAVHVTSGPVEPTTAVLTLAPSL